MSTYLSIELKFRAEQGYSVDGLGPWYVDASESSDYIPANSLSSLVLHSLLYVQYDGSYTFRMQAICTS